MLLNYANPTGTVTTHWHLSLVGMHRRDKPRTWVQILASGRFCHFFCSVLSSLLPLRSVGMSNFDKGLHNLMTLIQRRHQNNDFPILHMYIYTYTVIHIYVAIYMHVYAYVYIDSQRVSDFLFIPLRPFFYAALAKRWKVQFRKGLRKFNNVDSKMTF